MQELNIAFSSCPNDTFIFYALINNKLPDFPFKLNTYIADVEELNNLAFYEKFHVTKISFNALGYLQDKYTLLDSGSALGEKCGPLIITKDLNSINELDNKLVSLPGKYTTANFLFDIAVLVNVKKNFVKFDEIIDSILSSKADAGVIIHESRFTYENYNLKCLLDFGEWWEESTKLPIPLGGIAVSNKISENDMKIIDKYLKLSIKYAYENFAEAKDFIKEYAQEMDENTIKSHIELYVNDYTYSLGEKGEEAVRYFIKKGFEKTIFNKNSLKICRANG